MAKFNSIENRYYYNKVIINKKRDRYLFSLITRVDTLYY